MYEKFIELLKNALATTALLAAFVVLVSAVNSVTPVEAGPGKVPTGPAIVAPSGWVESDHDFLVDTQALAIAVAVEQKNQRTALVKALCEIELMKARLNVLEASGK